MATQTQGQIIERVQFKLNQLNERRFEYRMLATWLNDGIRNMTTRTECNRSDATITTTPNTQLYTVPNDIVRLHMVTWERDGDTSRYDLEFVPQKNLSSFGWTRANDTMGTPAIFYTWGYAPNLQIGLYPIPDDAGTLRLYYYSTPLPLTTDQTDRDTNIDVPQGWENCLVDYVTYEALLSDLDNTPNDNRWQLYLNKYEKDLSALSDAAAQFVDQAGMVVNGRNYVPAWLYDEGYEY